MLADSRGVAFAARAISGVLLTCPSAAHARTSRPSSGACCGRSARSPRRCCRRLPRADQPALVDARAARPDREHRPGDPRDRHRRHPARLRVAGPRAGPVPAHRLRHRRCPPLARVLDHLGLRSRGRLHLDHPEARRDRCRLLVPGQAGSGGHDRLPERRRGRSSPSPTPCPRRLLFVSAGSGVTPIMSMLRGLQRMDALSDVVHLHSARTTRGVHLRRLPARAVATPRRFPPARAADGRAGSPRPRGARRALPRLARARGLPLRSGGAARRHGRALGARGRLRAHAHRALPAEARRRQRRRGRDDLVRRSASRRPSPTARSRSWWPARRRASLCPSGAGRASATPASASSARAQVRDLRSGDVYGQKGEMIRTCISAPEGPVEIKL